MFKIEERGLPPSLQYINARLTGRPLSAILWLLVMIALSGTMYALDPHRGRTGDGLIVVAIVYFVIALAGLLSVVTRAEGRAWLLEKREESVARVSTVSRLVVRLVPLAALAVVIEYWFAYH